MAGTMINMIALAPRLAQVCTLAMTDCGTFVVTPATLCPSQ